MPPISYRSSLELLEARIAPAVLFLSGASQGPSSLTILDGLGHDAQDSPAELAALSLTGATAAVTLHAGDQLIFDRNGNHHFDRGDIPLAEVTAGEGLFFFTNGATGKNSRAFELTELTGVAASDGFAADIHTDVHGSVVTALDADGFLTAAEETLTVAPSSITHLTVDGQIARHSALSSRILGGHLFAGGDLSEITIGGPLYNAGLRVSVGGRIATGSGTSYFDVSFNGGKQSFQIQPFAPLPGADGGSIDHLTLSDGISAHGMFAGNGTPGAPGGPAGNGGSISHVSFGVIRAQQFVVETGGAYFEASSGPGGNGGSLTDVTGTIASQHKTLVSISMGSGGSSTSGAGGYGGAIEHLSLQAQSILGELSIRAGNGSSGGVGQPVGDGGDISDLRLVVNGIIGRLDSSLLIQAGNVYAGARAEGGLGGSIDHLSLTVTGRINHHAEIRAGDGSAERIVNGAFGFYGLGGSIADSSVTLNASVGSLNSNAYGVLAFKAGQGRVGGDIADVHVTNHADRFPIQFFGGGGFNGPGGDVRGVDVVDSALYSSDLLLWGGGGETGGDVAGTSLTKLRGHLRSVFIMSGAGNSAGDVDGLSIFGSGKISAGLVVAGDGVQQGGSVRNLTMHGLGQYGTQRDPFSIQPGGVRDYAQAGTGQSAGSLENFFLEAPHSYFQLGGQSFVTDTLTLGATGPAGSNISHISGTVGGIEITAGHGGNAPAGFGGLGGSVSDVTLKITRSFAHHIVAGNGGDGATGGQGGSIDDVRLKGDLGDFTKPFGFQLNGSFDFMGGLAVGMAGTSSNGPQASAGSIDHLTATRIAAIVAGRPIAELTAANAVQSIAHLTTTALGADTHLTGPHRAGNFDFKGGQNNAFDLGTDYSIDGLVLVKSGGLLTSLSVSPLKLLQV